MRNIRLNHIQKTIEELCLKANIELRADVLAALKSAFKSERDRAAKDNLKAILDNAKAARDERIPICQDTGMVVVYLEIGEKIRLLGGDLASSIDQGVAECYRKGCFRKSVVGDPLVRRNTKTNTPCVLYTRFVKGDRLKIVVTPKGFGSENKSKIKMFTPTVSPDSIKDFVVETVKEAGPGACPPFVVGVGIGGTFDKVSALAREALFRPINKRNPKPHLAGLEDRILAGINRLGMGPMGLGGKTTALRVNVLTYPTHIAGMPVAVNLSCHATRGATKVI